MTEADRPTIVVLDDEKNIRRSIEIALEQEGMQVIGAHDAASALRTLHERIVDALIIDIQLGEIDGLTFFRKIRADGIDVPAVFISGHATLSEAAEAVKIGGFDFLEKPFTAEKIAVTVRRCLEMSAIRERLRRVEESGESREVIGDSPQIRQVVTCALKVAPTQASVLITGESGTGKELIANLLHANSPRASGPMVKVNCSAIPDTLLESELFGYERGAFTGAVSSRKGLFEVAHRGTIFLDEVADLSASAQAKILRALQTGEIQKVGAERTLKVDVRVLSGTHKNLRELVGAGTFREDLFYRLNVVPIEVPPLRERPRDIVLLVGFFAQRICARNNLRAKQIEPEVLRELERYRWPGNVRELQNVMERMLIMSGDRVTLRDLPADLIAEDEPASGSGGPSALKGFRDQTERDFIICAIKKNHGNISKAATELGVGRTYLHRRLGVLKIARKDYF